jgi:hypothetical protein
MVMLGSFSANTNFGVVVRNNLLPGPDQVVPAEGISVPDLDEQIRPYYLGGPLVGGMDENGAVRLSSLQKWPGIRYHGIMRRGKPSIISFVYARCRPAATEHHGFSRG